MIICAIGKANAGMLTSESPNPTIQIASDVVPAGDVLVNFWISDPMTGSVSRVTGYYTPGIWYDLVATPNPGFRFASFGYTSNAVIIDRFSSLTQFMVNGPAAIITSFVTNNVVPEVPLGTIIASTTMASALALYLLLPRKPKQDLF